MAAYISSCWQSTGLTLEGPGDPRLQSSALDAHDDVFNRIITFLLTATLGGAAAAGAQTAGATLLVEARDQAGATVPGVLVTVVSEQTGLERAGVTVDDGTIWLVRLPPGTYTLTAVRGGFKTEVIQKIQVEAAARGRMTILMKPGAYTEQVVVEADATTLRIGNSAVGAVFDSDTLLELPVANREALEFAAQAPGMAPPAPGSRLSTQGNTGVNSAGAREASNNYLLDGVDNNDQFLNRLVINPSLDAIQEFALQQNTYDAEYGRSAGAQLNMVLKSGSRTRHGSMYEFFRHSALDASNPLDKDAEKPLSQRHQFGGTLGGPLRLPRSFFFVSGEGIDGREADTRQAHVPTALERAGDFSASGVAIRDPLTGLPFPGGVIPASRISSQGAAAGALYPAPNRADPQANLVSSPLGDRTAGQFTIKTDHTVWRGSPLTLRYSFSRDSRDAPFPVRARNLPGFGISVLDQGQNFGAGLTRALTARIFNELRVGVNALRRENLPQSSGTNGFTALGIKGPALPETDLGYMTMVVPGYETLGDDPNLPVVRRTRTIHVADALTFDRGRHHIKTGGELRTYRSDGYNHLFARGQATFTGAFTGQPFGDLLLGLPSVSLIAANDNRQALRTWAVNVFVQDDWRITPRVALNLGLRYEHNAPPYDADDRMVILNLDTLQLQPVGQNGVSRSGLNSDYNDIAPRVGMSWDVTGSGTWLVRSGYGMFYDAGTLIENSALYFNPPYFTLQLFFPGAQPLTLADPFPAGRGFSPRPSINTIDPDLRTAYSHQATVGLEGILRGTTTAVRYVTTYGTEPGAEAQHQSGHPRPWADRSAPPARGARRHAAGRVDLHVQLPCARVERVAPAAARRVVPRRLYPRPIAGRHVRVPGHRRRRQHAAGQPQSRRRVGPVGLRRAPAAGVDRALGRPAQRGVAHRAELAGQRGVRRAIGPSLHAARELRQQQHGQRRRRHLRLRSPEHRHGHAAGRLDRRQL